MDFNLAQDFPKSKRLLKANDYKALYGAKSKLSPNVKIIFKRNDSRVSRIGLAVSSKVGKAVTRNKIKRVSRECFRSVLFKESFDFLIIPNRSCDLTSFKKELKFFFSTFGSVV